MGINNSQRCKREICVQGAGTLDNTGVLFQFTPSSGGKVEVCLYMILRFSFLFFLVLLGILRVSFVKITVPH